MNRLTESNLLLAEQLTESIKQDYDACGIAVAVVDKNGETQYQRFWGVRDLETGREIDGDTIFGIASVTKSFTTMAILQLEERGILSIDDPISRYVPEFTNRNQCAPVLIRHLLCHSGGFFPLPRILVGDVAARMGLDEKTDGDFAYHEGLAEEGIRLVAGRLDSLTEKSGLNGRPGENYSYCNDGFALLSDIIRRYGGEKSYAAYLVKNILEPLGMERSFCDFVRPGVDENAAVLYQKTDGVMKGHRDYHDDAFVLHGGGSMKSTLNDLKKYLAMYLNEGRSPEGVRVLSQYHVREMVKPRIPCNTFENYGYGLEIKQMGDMKVIEHGGSLPGVSSNIAFSYESEAAVIVLCNTLDVPVGAVSDAFMKAYNGDCPVNTRAPWRETVWSTETVRAAAGRYVSGEGTVVELYEKADGRIGARTDGEEKHIIPTGPKTAIVRNRYTDTFVKLIETEARGLYAIQYGGRMIPRADG